MAKKSVQDEISEHIKTMEAELMGMAVQKVLPAIVRSDVKEITSITRWIAVDMAPLVPTTPMKATE